MINFYVCLIHLTQIRPKNYFSDIVKLSKLLVRKVEGIPKCE